MVVADSGYPLAGVMVTTSLFFGLILFLWMLITVYLDLFRRHDLGGWGKLGWVVFTLVLPFIGVFAYLAGQGRSVQRRTRAIAERKRRGKDEYIRSVSATSHKHRAAELAKARELLDSGAISQEEYEVMKHRAAVG
ncbi:MAG: SHOCT domain-containing protein [Jatrophihabitantaceae bacterium]